MMMKMAQTRGVNDPRAASRVFVSIMSYIVFFTCGATTVSSLGTSPDETLALQAIRKSFVDTYQNLGNWQGDDPCSGWTGVYCVSADYPINLAGSTFSHVTELRLLRLNLTGQLAAELGSLPALKYFNVMWNQISGSIPTTIGMLKNLKLLLLSGNQFTGVLPDELGLLASLSRLQIDQNMISGPLPATFLDRNLPSIQHMHMNNNSLNGSIPPGLGTLSTLHHLLLDNNQLTGTLPVELANLPQLLIIQLDNNRFDDGATIPAAYGTIPTLVKLSLRNCNLGGPIPNLSLLGDLSVLDLSYNFLTGSMPNATLTPNLTTIDLSHNQLRGTISENVGSLPVLQYLDVKNNNISGLIPSNLGSGQRFVDNVGTGVKILDFQDNLITDFANGSNLVTLQSEGLTKVWLNGNPFCNAPSQLNNPLCVPSSVSLVLDVGSVTLVPSADQSGCGVCQAPYRLAPSSQHSSCRCAAPVTVQWRLKSPSFGVFDPYMQEFIAYLASGLQLTIDQIQIQNYIYQPGPRLLFTLLFFPTVHDTHFNNSEVMRIYNDFAEWKIPTNNRFGPYELISFTPPSKGTTEHAGIILSTGAVVGIVAGAIVFVILKTLCMFYVIRAWIRRDTRGKSSILKRRTYSNIQVASVKSFTYEELAAATDNFSAAKVVGEGGYGKVYSGVLENGQKVAVKRAEETSHQGSHEFETEIQLLSRVHHRNLVSLLGYCNDEGEQMLVYEFIAYGSLHYHISPAVRVPLNFMTRLHIALGSASGIHYLHTQADPPIYHRDVKTSNILLDEKFQAKVADFGLSKLAPQPQSMGSVVAEGYISTVVKGTPGYLDPEYFKTHRLTDKSDVYSFGVVLLVLFTGMQPISEGKNLAREVSLAYVAGKIMSIVDPRMKDSFPPGDALDSFAKLALICCRDAPDERPTITEVVQELHRIWKEAYNNPIDSEKDKDKDQLTFSGDLFRKTSEDSFIEINPSLLSSVVSSTVWTSSNPAMSTADVSLSSLDPR